MSVTGTYNEAATVERVLDEIEAATDGRAEVVADSSADETPRIARERGATVVRQPARSYGVAVREALLAASNPIRITTDCDGTYPTERVPPVSRRQRSVRPVVPLGDVVVERRHRLADPAAYTSSAPTRSAE